MAASIEMQKVAAIDNRRESFSSFSLVLSFSTLLRKFGSLVLHLIPDVLDVWKTLFVSLNPFSRLSTSVRLLLLSVGRVEVFDCATSGCACYSRNFAKFPRVADIFSAAEGDLSHSKNLSRWTLFQPTISGLLKSSSFHVHFLQRWRQNMPPESFGKASVKYRRCQTARTHAFFQLLWNELKSLDVWQRPNTTQFYRNKEEQRSEKLKTLHWKNPNFTSLRYFCLLYWTTLHKYINLNSWWFVLRNHLGKGVEVRIGIGTEEIFMYLTTCVTSLREP